jgi:hypothetical protein
MASRSNWVACAISAVACGPTLDGAEGGGGSGSAGSSAGEPATTGSAASTDPTSATAPGGSTTDPDTGTGTGTGTEGSESGALEACVDGTFVGHFVGDFESESFVSCDSGDDWWFEGPFFGMPCPDGAWIRVEGTLCGPGNYGHLGGYAYQLSGNVVQGPCTAECGDSPAPEQCGTIHEVCPWAECGVVGQTCREGERCVPRSIEGVPPWTSSECVAEVAMARGLAEPCSRVALWQDDCAAGSFCAGDEDGNRTCAALCDPDAPACAGDELCLPCETDAGLQPIGVCGVEPFEC